MPGLEQASSAAERVDSVFLFIFALSALFLVFITFLMIYFVIRYSKKRNPKARDIEGHFGLEVTWTLVPLVLFLAMFYYGWTNFEYLRNAPDDAMVIKVTGRQWAWDFEYPNGKQTEELYLALDRPVRLEIRSVDVIHGFYVPAFRIKMDAVPGKANYTWFTPTRLGSFDIECSVICGTSHGYMLSKAVVVPEEEFTAWYFGGDDAPIPGQAMAVSMPVDAPPENPGLAILEANSCLSCHSLDGEVMVGPTFKDIYGREATVVGADGTEREIEIDDDYLERAIQDPMAETAKGYPPAMPTMPLSEEELQQVIDYLKTVE